MSLTRALAWNTGVQIIGKVISTALGVIIIGLMTRHLGQIGFGEYSTANAYLQIFALLLDLGLNVTLVAMLGERAGDKAFERRCVSAIFTFRLVIAAIVIVFIAPAIALAFPYSPALKLAIIALTGSFFFPALNQVVTGLEQRHLKMNMAAIGEILGRVVLLIGLILAIKVGWGLVPIVLWVSLGSFANFFVNFLYARPLGGLYWNWDPAFWLIALKRSWPIGLSIAFNLIYYKADTFVLSLVRTQAEVGIYGAAYRVLDILVTIPFMYAGVLLPILSKHWAGQAKEAFGKLLARSTDLMLLLVIPMMVGTIILGKEIMSVIAGKDFALAGDVLKILIVAVGIIYVNTVYSHAIVALNAQKKMLPIYIGVALVTLAGYLLFIPTYGMWAAAWLTVASEGAIFLGSFFMTRVKSSFSLNGRPFFAACLASLLMGIVVWYTKSCWLPIPILSGIVVYVIFILIFGGVSRETLKEILSLKKVKPTPTLEP